MNCEQDNFQGIELDEDYTGFNDGGLTNIEKVKIISNIVVLLPIYIVLEFILFLIPLFITGLFVKFYTIHGYSVLTEALTWITFIIVIHLFYELECVQSFRSKINNMKFI